MANFIIEKGILTKYYYDRNIIIPDSVTSIGNYVFYGCSKLTSITIPASVTSIGACAFYGCCGLTSITIPAGINSIEEEVFRGCSGLTSITIPAGVTSIGDWAFDGCGGLTSVTIPSSVTSIGDWAFDGCSGLTSVNYTGTKEEWDAINKGVDWDKATGDYIVHCTDGDLSFCAQDNEERRKTDFIIENGVLRDYIGAGGDVVIPDNVKEIGEAAFPDYNSLTSVVIPNSVTSIGGSALSGCSGLTSVVIPDSVKKIGESAFFDCSGLTSINYSGTKEEWNSIEKEMFWDTYTGDYVVHCADGDIEKV